MQLSHYNEMHKHSISIRVIISIVPASELLFLLNNYQKKNFSISLAIQVVIMRDTEKEDEEKERFIEN